MPLAPLGLCCRRCHFRPGICTGTAPPALQLVDRRRRRAVSRIAAVSLRVGCGCATYWAARDDYHRDRWRMAMPHVTPTPWRFLWTSTRESELTHPAPHRVQPVTSYRRGGQACTTIAIAIMPMTVAPKEGDLGLGLPRLRAERVIKHMAKTQARWRKRSTLLRPSTSPCTRCRPMHCTPEPSATSCCWALRTPA